MMEPLVLPKDWFYPFDAVAKQIINAPLIVILKKGIYYYNGLSFEEDLDLNTLFFSFGIKYRFKFD